MFKEVKKKKKFEVVLDQIKHLLQTNQLKTGQKLPGEIELSERLGISRSSLREAYTILSILGIIEARTGEGTIIKQAEPENLKSIMSLVAVSNNMSMEDLFEARIILEKSATELAAVNRTEDDINTINELLKEADRAYIEGDRIAQTNYDFLFHRAITESSKNQVLVMLNAITSDLLNEQIQTTRRMLSTSPDVLERFQNEHWSIFEAIKSQDANLAVKLVDEHLRNSKLEMGLKTETVSD